MAKYRCEICGYIYDPYKGNPYSGVPARVSFKSSPQNWICPVCGAGKDNFKPVLKEEKNE